MKILLFDFRTERKPILTYVFRTNSVLVIRKALQEFSWFLSMLIHFGQAPKGVPLQNLVELISLEATFGSLLEPNTMQTMALKALSHLPRCSAGLGGILARIF